MNGVWQRKKPRGKKNKKPAKRSANGTRHARPKQPVPELLIRFGDALAVPPVLGYIELAQRMANALMPKELSRAINEALRNAK